MTNSEISQMVEPWDDVLACAFDSAISDARDCAVTYGMPRKGERASNVHVYVREGLRCLSDELAPTLTLVEEPEGQGADFVVLNVGEKQLALRWSRWDGVRVNRNRTDRNKHIEEQSCFPFHMETGGGLISATLAYTLADDYTEAGQPCWWLDRVAIIRERSWGIEIIRDIATFEQPPLEVVTEPYTNPRIVARDDERSRMLALADDVMRKIG